MGISKGMDVKSVWNYTTRTLTFPRKILVTSAFQDDTIYGSVDLYNGSYIRIGEKIKLSNEIPLSISAVMAKGGSPTGSIYFRIRRVSDDTILHEEIVCNAEDLSTSKHQIEIILSDASEINEEVRLLFEYSGGDSSNYVRVWYSNTPEKKRGYLTKYDTAYTDTWGYNLTGKTVIGKLVTVSE